MAKAARMGCSRGIMAELFAYTDVHCEVDFDIPKSPTAPSSAHPLHGHFD